MCNKRSNTTQQPMFGPHLTLISFHVKCSARDFTLVKCFWVASESLVEFRKFEDRSWLVPSCRDDSSLKKGGDRLRANSYYSCKSPLFLFSIKTPNLHFKTGFICISASKSRMEADVRTATKNLLNVFFEDFSTRSVFTHWALHH